MRLDVDIGRVRALAEASAGRVAIAAVPSPDRPRFVLDLAVATAGSRAYPRERRTSSRVAIDLAARHPFAPPAATVLTPVFHPHVFPSGLVCVGAQWLPGEGMDLFVRRVVRLLAFDPLLMNPGSIANSAAQAWYAQVLRVSPDAFPTDPGALAMASGTAEPERRVVRHCPHCGAGLRLPADRSGSVCCPRCARDFATST